MKSRFIFFSTMLLVILLGIAGCNNTASQPSPTAIPTPEAEVLPTEIPTAVPEPTERSRRPIPNPQSIRM